MEKRESLESYKGKGTGSNPGSHRITEAERLSVVYMVARPVAVRLAEGFRMMRESYQ